MAAIRLTAVYVPAPDDEYEYLTLSELEEAAGVEIGDDLKAHLDDRCFAYFLVQDGQPLPPDLDRRFAGNPPEHRGGLVVAALPMLKTYDQRDPVLVVDAEELYLMFVMPPEVLERYIEARYKEHVPLLEPPDNKYARWVVSIDRKGGLLRTGVGLSPSGDGAHA